MGNSIRLKRKQKIGISIAFILMFTLIAAYLWRFGVQIERQEQTRGMEILSNLSVQGAAITENRIKEVGSVLWTVSRALEGESDLQSDEVMHYLKDIVRDGKTDIIRMGIVNSSGDARLTDDRTLNVSDKNFFKEAIQGREYISAEVVNASALTGSIAVAVPVFNRDEEVVAVLYGVIQTRDFKLYKGTMWDIDERNQYLHIIDKNGNYISRASNKNSIFEADNFYEDFGNLDSDVSVEEVRDAIARGEVIQAKTSKGDIVRYAYFAPLDINNWCIVTVLTGKAVQEQIGSFEHLVVQLIIKILVTVLIFGGYYYYTIIKEKKNVEKLNQELMIRDRAFKIAASETGNFVFTYDGDTEIFEFMNYDPEQIHIPQVIEKFPSTFSQYFDMESEAYIEVQRLLSEMKQGAEDAEGEISVHRGDELVVYYVQLMNVTGNAQKNIRVLGTLEDITEEKQTEIRLKKGEQIRSAVLSDAIEFFEVNLNKDCTMRDGVIKESPYTYTQIIEKFAELRVCEEYQEKVLETFSIRNLRHMYEIGVHDVSLEYLRKPEYGEPFWASCEAHLEKDVATDDIVALSVVRDIHDQKVRQIQLENQAILDPLTKAYNRNAGISKISEILEKYPDTSNALVFIDLDNFKGVNDTLGHFVGDTVLVDVVKIIKQHVRQKDIVCRMGGDEFLIFLVDIPREVIHRNIKKLLEKLNLTYERDGISESISASIGIAVTPEDGTDFQTLYEKADTTLYDVKKSSKNNFKFYEGN